MRLQRYRYFLILKFGQKGEVRAKREESFLGEASSVLFIKEVAVQTLKLERLELKSAKM